MALTKKQKAAVARAPKSQKAKMIQSFKSSAAPARKQNNPRQVRSGGFNAFSPGRPPLAFSIGRATFLRGLSRETFNIKPSTPLTGQTHTVMVFSGWPGHYVGAIVAVNATSGTASTIRQLKMESAGFASTGPSAVSPDTAMTARFSVRIRNVSAAVGIAGQVHVLNMCTGFQLAAGADYKPLVSYVQNHPRSVTYSSHEMRSCHQWNSHPIDQSSYHRFVGPTTTVSGFENSFEEPAMSTLVFVFPMIEGDLDQTYEVTACGNYYARYRLTGPLAHAAEEPPTAPLPVLNALRDAAERAGSMGMEVLSQAATGFGQAAFSALANRGTRLSMLPPLVID